MIKESKFQCSSIVYVNDCHDELSARASPVVTILLYLSVSFVVEIILEDFDK